MRVRSSCLLPETAARGQPRKQHRSEISSTHMLGQCLCSRMKHTLRGLDSSLQSSHIGRHLTCRIKSAASHASSSIAFSRRSIRFWLHKCRVNAGHRRRGNTQIGAMTVKAWDRFRQCLHAPASASPFSANDVKQTAQENTGGATFSSNFPTEAAARTRDCLTWWPVLIAGIAWKVLWLLPAGFVQTQKLP